MTGFSNPQAMWDKRFSTPDYVFGEEPNAFLVSQAALLGKGHALALADGEGRNSVWLAKQGFTVDAFDFSAPAIVKAKALADKHKVRVNFSCSAWQDFDWQAARYDLVAGIFFQFATPDERTELFQKINDSLKLGNEMLGQIRRIGKLHKQQVEQAGFAVLKAPDIPSVLVETAFISNPDEEARLNSESYQNELSDALMRSIERYFLRNPPLARNRNI